MAVRLQLTCSENEFKKGSAIPNQGVDDCEACDKKLMDDLAALLCDGSEKWLCIDFVEMSKPENQLFTKMSQ